MDARHGKSVIAKTGSGYLGDLDPKQLEVLQSFKESFKERKLNPWIDDAFLLRFCRARKFELEKVVEMFENYLEFRHDKGLDNLL